MMMTKTGQQLAIEGMEQAERHANEVHNNQWTALAWAYTLKYLTSKAGQVIQAEDLREGAEINGVPEPPSKRAWGAIIRRAAKEKFIRRIGYGPVKNPTAHGATASIWKVKNI